MNVLLTGNNGYLSRYIEAWLALWPGQIPVKKISLRDESWKSVDLSEFDAVIHLASIVHQKKTYDYEQYRKVNRELTTELARKAKAAGVRHFIFMSTMSVFGVNGSLARDQVIDGSMPCNPVTNYGRSKYEAELDLKELQDASFSVAIVRAPMVYGPGCPGNYHSLQKIVSKLPILPKIDNRRSMLFVLNFTEFIRLLLLSGESGVFYPQNKQLVDTNDIIAHVEKRLGKKVYRSGLLGRVTRFFGRLGMKLVIKAYGSLYYDSSLSNHFSWSYCLFTNDQSFELTEQHWGESDPARFIARALELIPAFQTNP